jgi:hypothetical protein
MRKKLVINLVLGEEDFRFRGNDGVGGPVA